MVAQQYARLYRANSVLTATPGQLVLMLYDGALSAMSTARDAFGRPATDFRRFETINKQILKAQRIIAELKGTLNFEVGGDFAPLMDRLYAYYDRRLTEANLKKNLDALNEVDDLLRQIRNAWAEMLRRQNADGSIDSPAVLTGAMVASAQPGLS